MISISDDIILFAVNPLGFLVSMGLLAYGEYVIIKSIANDPHTIYLKKFFYNIYHSLFRGASLNPSEQKILAILAQKENIGTKEISHDANIAINTVRKLTKDLVNKGYVSRRVYASDRRAFCYMPSHRHIQKIRRYT